MFFDRAAARKGRRAAAAAGRLRAAGALFLIHGTGGREPGERPFLRLPIKPGSRGADRACVVQELAPAPARKKRLLILAATAFTLGGGGAVAMLQGGAGPSEGAHAKAGAAEEGGHGGGGGGGHGASAEADAKGAQGGLGSRAAGALHPEPRRSRGRSLPARLAERGVRRARRALGRRTGALARPDPDDPLVQDRGRGHFVRGQGGPAPGARGSRLRGRSRGPRSTSSSSRNSWSSSAMIKLSRLDRQEIALNCDLIVSIEAHPDTTLRLTTGESLLVLESVDEVVESHRGLPQQRAALRRAPGAASPPARGRQPGGSSPRRRETRHRHTGRSRGGPRLHPPRQPPGGRPPVRHHPAHGRVDRVRRHARGGPGLVPDGGLRAGSEGDGQAVRGQGGRLAGPARPDRATTPRRRAGRGSSPWRRTRSRSRTRSSRRRS